MSEVKTVTPEELQQVQELQNAYVSATYDLGQLSIQKRDLVAELEGVEEQLEEAYEHLKVLKGQEADLSTTLQQKYGSSTIDLTTGNIVS